MHKIILPEQIIAVENNGLQSLCARIIFNSNIILAVKNVAMENNLGVFGLF